MPVVQPFPELVVRGGRVFDGERFVEADVRIEGGVVAEVTARASAPASAEGREGAVEASLAQAVGGQVLDARGHIVAPGFVDLHFHGCMGADFCDGTAEALTTIARYEASRGVTSICPATMTYPEPKLAQIADAARAFEPEACEAALVGINMEGPFISPDRVGAQNPAYVQPCDAAMVTRLQERSGGLIKLVDVAPEMPDALDFVRAMSTEVRVSLAHTCADYECARAAFGAGARHMTHLFNAMPGMHHREPGPIAAAAERDDVTPEIIADGVHVHPAMVRLAFSLFGPERMILVSDSMRACGLGDGVYDLGGQDVSVSGNVATLADGTIAGSVTDLASCVRIAVRDMGIPLEHALRAATANPAGALGLGGGRGRVEVGGVADLVLLDDALEVESVIVRGEVLGR